MRGFLNTIKIDMNFLWLILVLCISSHVIVLKDCLSKVTHMK